MTFFILFAILSLVEGSVWNKQSGNTAMVSNWFQYRPKQTKTDVAKRTNLFGLTFESLKQTAAKKNLFGLTFETLAMDWMTSPIRFRNDDNLVLGIKVSLANLQKQTVICLSRVFSCPDASTLRIDAGYHPLSEVVTAQTTWVSKNAGLEFFAAGDSEARGRLTAIGMTSKRTFLNNIHTVFHTNMNLLKHNVFGMVGVDYQQMGAQLSYDTESHDPILCYTHQVTPLISLQPSISLRNPTKSYESRVIPWVRMGVVFKGKGMQGQIITKIADYPQKEMMKTHVSMAGILVG